MRFSTVLLAMLAATLLLGCPKKQQAPATQGAKNAVGLPLYPVIRSSRNYIKVNEAVQQAWGLVEDTYAVILQKWQDSGKLLASNVPADQAQGAQMRNVLNDEIQQNVFFVNPQIEGLFQQAIAAEPDNPLNYAAYAYYLKPRKRYDPDGKPMDTEGEAVEQIDKAIELWPDESSFYLVKINIITAPQMCHEWVRSSPYETEELAQRMDVVRELLSNAEKYDPDNGFIDYYGALLEAHFGDAQFKQGSETETVPFSDLRERVLREIRSGNMKPDNRFFFPPPLQPYAMTARNMKLREDSMEPAYVDQWNQFGHWDTINVDTLMTKMTDGWTWKNNKEDVGQLLLMLYRMGQTEPYDRSFFGLVLKLMQPFQESSEQGSPERLALGQAMLNLDSHYMKLSSEIITRKLLNDPTQVGVIAVHKAELDHSREPFMKEHSQGHFATWLKKANETLGLGLELGDDPEKW